MKLYNNMNFLVKNNIYYNSLIDINSLEEYLKREFILHQISKFNVINTYNIQKCLKLISHISFKELSFDKKKIVVSLFLLELLTVQKSFLIKSSTDNLFLKIRQGSPVGCKVTLRKKRMYEMLDSLILAFTRISTRSFIKISKKIQFTGGRFFSYQIDSLERFFHLTSITLGEEVRKLDITLVFSNHIWQESVFYMSSIKMPLIIKFKLNSKLNWNLNKYNLKKNNFLKNNKTNNNNIKKVFLENEVLFYLNRLFFILNKSKVIIFVNKSSTNLLINLNKDFLKFKKNIISEIKISQKYLRLLTLIKNFPLKKNIVSGNLSIIILNNDIKIYELAKIFDLFSKTKDLLPIVWIYDKKIYSIQWFFNSKLKIYLKNDQESLSIFLMTIYTNLINLISILNLIKNYNK